MVRRYSFITMLFVIGWSFFQSAHGQLTISHPHAAVPLSQFQQQNLWSTGKLYLPNSHSDFAMDSDLAINVTSRLTPTDTISLFGGAYWYHTKIINDTSQSAWVLSVDNGLIEFLDYYWLSDGQLTHLKSGYHEQDEYILTYGKTLDIAKGQTGELLVLMDSPYYASLPAITMTSVDDYRQESLINLVIITLALGALLCLSLYNIFLYIGTKDPALFHYAAYLLSYFAAWALTFQLPTELFGFSALTLHYLPFFLLPYFSGCFCIHFLELRKTMPQTANVLKIIGLASAITGVLSIMFFSMAHTLATVFIGLWIAVALYAGVKRWLSGFKPASFFVVAFMCLLLPASIILPANIGVIPDLLGNSELVTLVGGTLDAIFLAFAIAYRMRLISEENIQLTSELESKVMQRTEALAQSNKELQQANESKRMFLANMSHEIRTPMTSIIGYADIMRKDAIATDERQEFSTIIYDSSRHLLSILDDLLDLSKIEAKKLDFQMTSVDLLSIISVSQNIHRDAFNDKPVEFRVHCQYPLPSHIETDEVRLKQILFNLISNALKFTEQGTVELNVSCRNEKLVFDIVDTGIGMDNEQISRLFNAFEQADNSISRRFGGTGLGLNISSQLALGLSGTLDCQSQLGRGSTFTLKLPLKTTSDTQWMAREPQQTIKPRTSKLEVILPNLKGCHILIADDLESNRGLFTLMLERVNAKVTCVNDGREAVDECARQTFDLILLDIHMPRMDGVEAMRTIKSLHPNVLIIALTANTMTHQIAEFLTAGFDAHIAKPIVQSDFYGIIESTLKHSETNTVRVDEEVNAMLANLSELFLEELKSHLQAMARALKSSNWSVLKQHSHQLKGGAGSFGFSELGALCVELDNLVSVPEPQIEPISSVLEKIEKVQKSL